MSIVRASDVDEVDILVVSAGCHPERVVDPASSLHVYLSPFEGVYLEGELERVEVVQVESAEILEEFRFNVWEILRGHVSFEV